MTPNLALDYIKRRMRELGYGNNYHTKFKHFILQVGETKNVKAFNSYFILVEEPVGINIKSQDGYFDLTMTNADELHYEHHGQIRIRNIRKAISRVRFIQVIPYK